MRLFVCVFVCLFVGNAIYPALIRWLRQTHTQPHPPTIYVIAVPPRAIATTAPAPPRGSWGSCRSTRRSSPRARSPPLRRVSSLLFVVAIHRRHVSGVRGTRDASPPSFTFPSPQQQQQQQILVTGYDFTCADRRDHIQYCVDSLLKLVRLVVFLAFPRSFPACLPPPLVVSTDHPHPRMHTSAHRASCPSSTRTTP